MKLLIIVLLGLSLSQVDAQSSLNGRFLSFRCQGRGRGFELHDSRCQDINECERRPPVCRRNQRCLNTHGSYVCIDVITTSSPNPCQPNPCRPGHSCRRQGSRHTCPDINECTERPGICTGNRVCVNTVGSYNCQCRPGYGGSNCADIDECRRRPCPTNSVCRNTRGSFRCTCRSGYSGEDCDDVNECARNPSPCNPRRERCINSPGSFRCVPRENCRTGYAGTPCVDINECQRSPCRSNQDCVNTAGSYRCENRRNCPAGYAGNPCRAVLSADGKMCGNKPRKYGRCFGSNPKRHTTMDECTKRTDDCEDGTILGQLFVDNVIMDSMDSGEKVTAQAAVHSSGGTGPRQVTLSREVAPPPTKMLTFHEVDEDENIRCITKFEENRDGTPLVGKCIRPGEVNTRRSKRQAPVTQQTNRDLLIMLDESGSVGFFNFAKVKRIAAAIVRLLCEQISVNPRKTRVAISTFDRTVTLPVRLLEGNSRDSNAEELANYIISHINYNHATAGRTCLISALEHAYFTALDASTGGRRGDPTAEQDIIIISDGCETCVRPASQANTVINHITNFFIQEAIHVYVIGIGLNRACRDTLAVLAQGGRCFHFFYLDRWEYEVDQFVYELENPLDDICLNLFESPFGECLDPLT